MPHTAASHIGHVGALRGAGPAVTNTAAASSERAPATAVASDDSASAGIAQHTSGITSAPTTPSVQIWCRAAAAPRRSITAPTPDAASSSAALIEPDTSDSIISVLPCAHPR